MITTDNKSINFIKKEDLTGGYHGMRYIMQKQGEAQFKTTIWPEPFCFEKTPEEQKESKEFPLTTEGRDKAIDWLNERYEARKADWDKAMANDTFYHAVKGK
ncbi:MAG: GNAT family acetyltransferase [bacterium]|nr:GNAT family acetyltransferase [bacterium]